MAKNRKADVEMLEEPGVEQDVTTTDSPKLQTFSFPAEGVTVEATDAADAAQKLKGILSHKDA